MRHLGNRKGIATALTMSSTVLLLLIPTLLASWLFGNALYLLSTNIIVEMGTREDAFTKAAMQIEQWLTTSGWAERVQLDSEELTQSLRSIVAAASRASLNWLAVSTLSIASLVMPTIVFMSVLGTLLSNTEKAINLLKKLSPLDDGIDQLFLDSIRENHQIHDVEYCCCRHYTRPGNGTAYGIGGNPTSHWNDFACQPPCHPAWWCSDYRSSCWHRTYHQWESLVRNYHHSRYRLLVAALANRVRPRMVSKDVHINRAFMLMCVSSGISLFGFFGVVYGPLIMILFTTTLEVYLQYDHSASHQ